LRVLKPSFLGIPPFVSAAVTYDPAAAAELVHDELNSKLPGEPWKGLDR
jgi:hypothetical protein